MWPYPWTHVGTPSHLGNMDRVAATMPSQAHAGAAQEAPDIGQWEGQDVPLVRPSSCNVKGGIPSSRRYLPTYLHHWEKPQTISELRSFMGFCNYYSGYVRMYAELSGPLHKMLQVGKFDGRKGRRRSLPGPLRPKMRSAA